MRKLLTTMFALAALALAVPAQAANGVFNLNWDSCIGPLDKAIAPGDEANPNLAKLFGSVIGIDVPHKAYQMQIIFGNGGATPQVPDAWRFDGPNGCQGPGYGTMDHLSTNKACPSMQASLSSLQIKDVNFVPDALPPQYSRTLLRATLANSYPDGILTVSAATRYHLGAFVFNHQYSVNGSGTPGVTCGGLDVPICFATIVATYLTMDGAEIDFDMTGSRLVTANGSAGCTPTPAKNATWGAIKSQYRN